jgi:hypothetical protein
MIFSISVSVGCGVVARMDRMSRSASREDSGGSDSSRAPLSAARLGICDRLVIRTADSGAAGIRSLTCLAFAALSMTSRMRRSATRLR